MMKNSDLSFIFLKIIVFFIVFTVFLYNTSADETAYEKAIDYIENLNNRIPNDEDYFQVCSFSDTCFLNSPERLKIWKKIISLQKSNVSCADLLSIFRTKRDSLNDIKIIYSEKMLNRRNTAQQTELQYTYTFAFAPNSFFLERNGKRRDNDYEHVIISYDGNVMKTVTEPDSDLPNANVMKTTPLQMFYHINMPLFPAMLFDPARCNALWQFNFDLESFLKAEKTHVFERDIQLNGKKCILVLDLSTKIYLDTEKDFSVIRFEKYAHNAVPVPSPQSFSGQDVRITGRTLIYRSDLMDLKNCENGIWIPLKIENTIFNKQNIIEQSVVIVKDVQVNKGIPKTFFTEIIPENSFVFDAPNNLTYKQSDNPSINSLIKETAKSKRILIYRYISIISGLALIFIALVMKYRAYLKNKRESENKVEKTK